MTSETEHIENEELMVRYLSGEATTDEQNQLLLWLKQNPENVAELRRVRHAAESCKQVSEPNTFDTDKAFERFETSIATKKSGTVRKLLFWSASIAAMLVLLFSIKIFNIKSADKNIILGISKNLKQNLVLVDGSNITLNAHSSLSAKNKFDKTSRTVILKGEAFFDVKHDASHPFIIKVDSVTVKVLGTAFNILPDSITHNIVVTVQRGRVAVMYKDESIIITAGEQATYINKLEKIDLTKSNIENYDSWKTGQLVFNDTPLEEVIEALNKQYATHFEIGSPELNECKLNASFNYTDIKKVEELLSVVLKVDVKTENGKQLLYCRTNNKK
jgi:transmembrane sensor